MTLPDGTSSTAAQNEKRLRNPRRREMAHDYGLAYSPRDDDDRGGGKVLGYSRRCAKTSRRDTSVYNFPEAMIPEGTGMGV
mmetsp:Transcript_41810/g.97922  ORF Transcript_41810/g.97922 Transcript_41810/m.97922 type:complete len:81 (+) Transcript_41810:3307-3549(+)